MMHTYAEEEPGYLVCGYMLFAFGGMGYELRTGDVWQIPTGVPMARMQLKIRSRSGFCRRCSENSNARFFILWRK
jgi:hypothetical protein